MLLEYALSSTPCVAPIGQRASFGLLTQSKPKERLSCGYPFI